MTSFELSTPDEFAVQARTLQSLTEIASEHEIEFLIIGALARDLLVHGVAGRRPDRATKDIDIGVALPDWAAFDRLASSLQRVPGHLHRFVVDGTCVDVVPFDGVETQSRTITWPNESTMTVLGMTEALATAVTISIGELQVKVASLGAQVLLKILAWHDRHTDDAKDAKDLKYVINAYEDEPFNEAVGESELIRFDFDWELASAYRAGRDAMGLILDPHRERVASIVRGQATVDGLLARDMGADIARTRRIVQALADGMDDVRR